MIILECFERKFTKKILYVNMEEDFLYLKKKQMNYVWKNKLYLTLRENNKNLIDWINIFSGEGV